MGKLRVACRVGALVLLASMGLFCEAGGDEASDPPGTPKLSIVTLGDHLPGEIPDRVRPLAKLTVILPTAVPGCDADCAIIHRIRDDLQLEEHPIECSAAAFVHTLRLLTNSPFRANEQYEVTLYRDRIHWYSDDTVRLTKSVYTWRFRTADLFAAGLEEPSPTRDVPLDSTFLIRCSSALMAVSTDCVRIEADSDATSDIIAHSEVRESYWIFCTPSQSLAPRTAHTIRLHSGSVDVEEGQPAPDPEQPYEWEVTTADPDVNPEPAPEFQAAEIVLGVAGSPWWIELAADGSGNGFALIGSDELDSASPEMWDHIHAVPVTACAAGAPVQLVFDAGVRGRGDIAVNTDGEGIAAGPSRHLTLGDHGIWIRHYNPVTGWSSATTPPMPTHDDPVRSVQVGIAENGDGVVSYLAPPPTASDYWHIEYTTYTKSTDTWSSPVPVSTSVDLKDPVLAVGDAGDAVVAATEDASDAGVVYHCLGTGGGRIPPTTGYTASQARLAMNGAAFIVWRETNAGATDTRIRTARTAGCAAPAVTFVDGGGAEDLSMPDIVVASDGSATAAWIDRQVGSDHDVVVNRYVVGTGWGTTPQAVMNSTYYLMDARAAISPGGQVSILGRSSAVAEVCTLLPDGSPTPPEDVTTIEGAISLQMVEDASLLYMERGQLTVGFVTVIGGIPDAALTLCK